MRRSTILCLAAVAVLACASCTGELGLAAGAGDPGGGDVAGSGDIAMGGDPTSGGDTVSGGDPASPGDSLGGGDPWRPNGDSLPPSTTFLWTPLVPSLDTQTVYLRNPGGDDGNDCLSELDACATLMRGYEVLRDGYPDWLVLRRGDEWTEAFSDGWNFSWDKSGRSASEPMVVTSYGPPGPRPLIKAGQEHGFHRHRDTDSHDLWIVDLHFKAHTRDPYSADYVSRDQREFQSGFRWTGGGSVTGILIEGCKFEFFGSNFAMHPSGSATFYDVRLRGNVFFSAWTGDVNAYSQGMYSDGVDGLLVEGNVFDRNGGLIGFTNDPNSIVPTGLTALDVAVTWFNHQAYIQSGNRNVTVMNNIFANADGVQLRPGGVAQDNLFSRCVNSLNVGPATVPVAGGVGGVVRNNVFVEGTDFAPESNTPGVRAQGINIANINATQGLLVEGNIFADDMSTDRYGHATSANGQNCGSGNAYPCPVGSLTLRNNVLYNWRGGFRFAGALGSELSGISVTANQLQNPVDDGADLLQLSSGWDATVFSFSDNVYHRGGNANWFGVGGTDYDLTGWLGVASETGAQAATVTFPDPTRGVAAYDAAQGGAGTHDSFMSRARQQSKASWDPAYEALSVNAWIRAGFVP